MLWSPIGSSVKLLSAPSATASADVGCATWMVMVSLLVSDPSLAVKVTWIGWPTCAALLAKKQKTPESGRKYELSGRPEADRVTGAPSGSVATMGTSKSLPRTTVGLLSIGAS